MDYKSPSKTIKAAAIPPATDKLVVPAKLILLTGLLVLISIRGMSGL